MQVSGRGKRVTLYEDTLAQVLEEARENGDTALSFEAVDVAVLERSKKIVRWTEDEEGRT